MEGAVAARRVTELSLDDALEELAVLQLEKAALDAREQRLVARLDSLDRVENPDTRWTRESVAAILRCAPVTAQHKLTMAGVLVTELPATLQALDAGVLTPAHVRVVLDAVTVLDVGASAALQARVLPQAESLSVAEFRKRCIRAVLTVDPDGADRRHEAALDQRRVDIRPTENGMADLYAHLSADGAARVRQHLDACTGARRETAAAPGLDSGQGLDARRGVDALRADVLVALCTGGAMAPTPRCRPVLIDRDGRLEALGARRYRPSALLELTLKLHDRTCQFPGCRRRATRSETDHVMPFDHDDPALGGLTVLANLHTLCKRHHRLKHEAGWTVVRKDDVTHWRSPAGRRYSKPAYRYIDPAPQPEPLSS